MAKLIITEDRKTAYTKIRNNPPAYISVRHYGIWKKVVDKDKHYSYGAAVNAFKAHMNKYKNVSK